MKEKLKEKNKYLPEKFSSFHIPIWFQLSLSIITIIALISLSLSFVFLNRQEKQLYEQTVRIGLVSLNYYTSDAGVPLLENDILRLNTLIKEAPSVEGILYAVILDHNQVIKAHSDLNQIGLFMKDFENIKNVTHDGDISYFNYTLPSGEVVLNLHRPIVFKSKRLGEVHVGVSIKFIEDIIRENRESIIVMTLVIMLLSCALTVLFARRFSSPISKLELATREISNGNYQNKINLIRRNELGKLAVAFNQMTDDLWEKSLMQETFGKYVGHEVLEMIKADPKSSWLKGHRNVATIIFIDIRGFTAYSETKEPEEIVEKLNHYFTIATHVIFDHKGYVDKFVGDGVLGVFGVPVHPKNHAERAVRAALEMRKVFQEESKNGNKLLSAVGISVHTGVVIAGNIGSKVKMEYTVIGDCVNVASRLNGLAGPGEIVISKNVYDQLGDTVSVKALPLQKIKGKLKPIEPYQVFSMKA